MKRKMFIQCSCCGYHWETSPMLGIPEGMYYNGYRAVGDALYCPDCVKTWKDRNGEEFDNQYKNPSKMFANWWNNNVNAFVDDKARIKTYRIVNGIYEKVAKPTEKGGEG